MYWHFLFTKNELRMLKDACYRIGFIQRTHGLKGEVTAVLEAEVPGKGLEALFVEIDSRLVPYFIKDMSPQGGRALIRFEDIDDLEQAKGLVGKSLYLQKTLRPRLSRGEFYDDEVVGFAVIDSAAGDLGTVREVIEAGPNRLVAVTHGNKEVLIPVNGPFIKSVNKSRKIITVELPEGFLDL